MKKKLFVNGRFLTQPLSGMQRYAQELITALDELFDEDARLLGQFDPVVFVPRIEHRRPAWKHFSIAETGRMKGHAWEQIELGWAAKGGILLNLTSAGPLLHSKSVLVMHDAGVFAHPEHFSKTYGMWHRFLRPKLARRAWKLVTISEFSRRELAKYCRVPADAFTIIGDSAEHILKVTPDTAILARNDLTPGNYALTVGNQTPNKNIAFAVKAFLDAEIPGWKLAVAGGGSDRIFGQDGLQDHASIVKLGRVSDEELRALYENAGVFLFPSRYEGFGVPPLEAILLGCPVISSDTSAMPEILSGCATLCSIQDTLFFRETLRMIVSQRPRSGDLLRFSEEIGRRYNWKTAAKILYSEIG